MSKDDPCRYCGLDAEARCKRCGERICKNHYIVSVSLFGDNKAYIDRGTGPVLRLFPDNWGPTKIRAYASGGPACDECRMAAGEEGAKAARDGIDNLLASTDVAQRLKKLYSILDVIPREELSGVLAKATLDVFPKCDLVRFRTEYQKVRISWRRSEYFPRHIPVSREPVVYAPGTGIGILGDGRFARGIVGNNNIQPAGGERVAIVRPGSDGWGLPVTIYQKWVDYSAGNYDVDCFMNMLLKLVEAPVSGRHLYFKELSG